MITFTFPPLPLTFFSPEALSWELSVKAEFVPVQVFCHIKARCKTKCYFSSASTNEVLGVFSIKKVQHRLEAILNFLQPAIDGKVGKRGFFEPCWHISPPPSQPFSAAACSFPSGAARSHSRYRGVSHRQCRSFAAHPFGRPVRRSGGKGFSAQTDWSFSLALASREDLVKLTQPISHRCLGPSLWPDLTPFGLGRSCYSLEHEAL